MKLISLVSDINYAARFWNTQEDGRIRCELCPRLCHLKDGQRGFCYVRQNVKGQLDLTTYGRSSGFCIDPIEKKPLNHFFPGSSVLSFGTAGCNLGCKFCQNWDISKARSMDRLADEATPERIALAAQRSGCTSVAFTYNDPVIFAEYAIDVAAACHEIGIKAVAVTAGYMTDLARPEFYASMDAANVDLKGFTEHFYHKITGGQLQPVLDTLVYLKHETDVWFEITNLLIPSQNDSEPEIESMCGWIVENLGVDVPLHFTAFHPDYRMRDVPRTPTATLLRSRAIAKRHGIQYVYVGNVHEPEASATYCSQCGTCLVERDWYQLGEYHLDASGNCMTCGSPCAGRFGMTKGHWGAKRQPISL